MHPSTSGNIMHRRRRARLLSTSWRETTFSNDALMPTVSTCVPLRAVGRSRTDPGTVDESLAHNDSSRPTKATLDLDLKRVASESQESGLPALNDIIGLTSYQQKLLVQSWPNIYSNGPNGVFASNIYGHLCNRNANAKALMQKADTAAAFAQSDMDCSTMHTRLTLDLIDNLIKSLEQSPDRFMEYLMDVGQHHRHLKAQGLSQAVWDDLGDAILDSVRKFDLVRKHKELRRAWLALVAFIIDHLKQGHTQFRGSRQSSVDVSDNKV